MASGCMNSVSQEGSCFRPSVKISTSWYNNVTSKPRVCGKASSKLQNNPLITFEGKNLVMAVNLGDGLLSPPVSIGKQSQM